MQSPFMGMDPYLEDSRYWSDVPSRLGTHISTQLNRYLLPKYHATVETTITYEDFDTGKVYPMRPDLTVYRQTIPVMPIGHAPSPIDPAPIVQEMDLEIETKSLAVHIYLAKNRRMVTGIEIHSPANKRKHGKTYRKYLRKRKRLLNSDVHVMELDLLRAGERVIMGQNLPKFPYFATLSRAKPFRDVEIWPIALGQPLPTLPVPLLDPDPDVPLDLNTALRQLYVDGGYKQVLDYSQPPPPPLTEAEQQLVDEVRATLG